MTVYRFLGQGSILGIPTPVIILAIVAIVSSIVLRRTVYGAADLCGGEQCLRRPRYSGISPAAIIVSVYTVSGLLTG